MKIFSGLTLALALTLSFSAHAAKWKVDPVHSNIGFTVRHMVVTKVSGQFKEYEGEFEFDPTKGTLGNHKFVVKTASIDTLNPKRDEHLVSADFFNAAKHPTITLTNSKITKAGAGKFKWASDLTMNGVTKPVTFDLEFLGVQKDAQGNNRAGFSATTKINRKDWGITWNKTLDAGGVAVSDDVQVQFDVAAVEQK